MEIELNDILETSKNSFKFFMRAIIGLENPPFLNDLDDILSDTIYKKVVAAYPRGHGKSTHLSIGYPLWRIAKDRNLRIMLVSNTATVAQAFLRGVMNHIESNEKYKAFAEYCSPYGQTVLPKIKIISSRKMEERWSSQAITVDRDDISLKDPSIQALGLFGSIISKRADIIVADDIVDQKNSETEEQREKIKDWLYTTLLPCLIPGGQFIYLGNTWHANDLVQDLLRDPQFEFRQRLKAIIEEPPRQDLWQNWAKIRLDDSIEPHARMEKAEIFLTNNKKDMMEGSKVLWPDRMPYPDLYLLRLSNSYSFARMYQCDPMSRPDQKFEEIWLSKAKEKGKDLVLQDAPRDGLTMDYTTSGLDLAISLKDTADDTVLFTLDRVKYGNDVIKTGDFVIRNIKRGKFTPNEVRLMVKSHNDLVKPIMIRVESVAYQQSMVNDLIDLGMINIRGYKTGGEKNDPEVGVNSIAVLLEIGKFVIPYNMQDPRTIELCSKLVDEMRSWPDGHTGDSLMALWFAYLEMRDLSGKRFIIPGVQPMSSANIPETERKKLEMEADMELIKMSNVERRTGRNQSRTQGWGRREIQP